MPSCTVTVSRPARRRRASIWRIASDAQMKQSTWRYFQRESALPLEVEVDAARRDQRAASLGCVLIDSASAAIATPCGSCAWTMSGCSCLMTRDRRQAAPRVHLGLGASGRRSSPSAARRRSSPSACATSIGAVPERAQARARSRAPGSVRPARCAPCRCGARTSASRVGSRPRRSARLRGRRLAVLQLPELRELQEDVVRIQRPRRRTRRAPSRKPPRSR